MYSKVFSQFSRSVVSESLQPHWLQHARLPCPSPTPGNCSNSCLWSRWCHPTISSSVVHFYCLQSLPASGSFPMSQFFPSGGQRIGVSASSEYSGLISFRIDWSLCCPMDFQESSSTTVWKHQFFGSQLSLWSNSHICIWLLEKP